MGFSSTAAQLPLTGMPASTPPAAAAPQAAVAPQAAAPQVAAQSQTLPPASGTGLPDQTTGKPGGLGGFMDAFLPQFLGQAADIYAKKAGLDPVFGKEGLKALREERKKKRQQEEDTARRNDEISGPGKDIVNPVGEQVMAGVPGRFSGPPWDVDPIEDEDTKDSRPGVLTSAPFDWAAKSRPRSEG